MCLRSLHSLPSLLSLPRHSRLVKIDPAVDLGRLGKPGRLGRLIVAPVQALARTARAPREVRAPEHRYHSHYCTDTGWPASWPPRPAGDAGAACSDVRPA